MTEPFTSIFIITGYHYAGWHHTCVINKLCVSVAYICYHSVIICQHVLLAFHLFQNFEKIWTLGEFWKTYLGILAENLRKILEILRRFLRYFEIILWNCLECFHEISCKIQKNVGKINFGLILGKLWRNNGVTLNY